MNLAPQRPRPAVKSWLFSIASKNGVTISPRFASFEVAQDRARHCANVHAAQGLHCRTQIMPSLKPAVILPL